MKIKYIDVPEHIDKFVVAFKAEFGDKAVVTRYREYNEEFTNFAILIPFAKDDEIEFTLFDDVDYFEQELVNWIDEYESRAYYESVYGTYDELLEALEGLYHFLVKYHKEISK